MAAYQQLCSEFYDLDKPEAPRDAFDFYLSYAQACRGPILEPMCGSGRFLVPLLARGLDIEGSDLSPDMLQRCRARATSLGLSPLLAEQRLSELTSTRRFDLVFIPSSSFCLLTDPGEVRASLSRVRELMTPGATFLVEIERLTARPSETSGTWGGRWVEREDGAKILISWLPQYSAAEGIARSVHRYDLVKDGALVRTEYEDFALKFYEPAAFEALLLETGFVNVKQWKTYERVAPDDSDEGMIFEAQTPS